MKSSNCTISDHNITTEEDIGSNFFLDQAALGQSRARHCCEFLRELNSDVNGDYIDENLDNIIQHNPEVFKNFSVVVACNLNEKSLIKLSNLLWDLNIPLMACSTVGFVGIARIQMNECCAIETHPENRQYDLRLEEPFEALKAHVEAIELGTKVPWLIVLYKHVEKFREKYGKLPDNYKEKSELRDMIRSSMSADEENFEEAIKAVNTTFVRAGRVNSHLQEIFNENSCLKLDKSSPAFWIMTRAVKDFVENEGNGLLPLPGILPDMTAETSLYINLQNVYRAKALQDADFVLRRVQELLKDLNKPNDWISEKDVRLFCREAANISVIRGSKISDEYEKLSKVSQLADELENPDSLISHYIVMRAFERFKIEHGYTPGEVHLETDTARIKAQAAKILNDLSLSNQINDDLLHEVCRYGGAEIHSIAAFLGGVCAHEVVKLVTRQYKPFDNTLIYDGVKAQTLTFKF